MHVLLRFSLAMAAAALASCPALQAQTRPAPIRPQIVTEAQYRCLIRNIDRIAVGRRGNLVDLSECPPAVILNSYPVPPDAERLFLKPDDIACLKRASRSRTIAVRRKNGLVALYLQPCGR